jgi:hypothetical protein
MEFNWNNTDSHLDGFHDGFAGGVEPLSSRRVGGLLVDEGFKTAVHRFD